MLATLKHFPGHGDTDVDSHLGLPVVPAPARAPRRRGAGTIQGGHRRRRRGVMVAHIEMPSIDADRQPATFSHKVISTLLRPGFDGLIFTDAMNMAAITKMASPGEAAVRAVKAGIDVVLDSPDSAAAAAAIANAIKTRRHSSRADRAVGAPHSRSQGAGWPASHPRGESRGDPAWRWVGVRMTPSRARSARNRSRW